MSWKQASGLVSVVVLLACSTTTKVDRSKASSAGGAGGEATSGSSATGISGSAGDNGGGAGGGESAANASSSSGSGTGGADGVGGGSGTGGIGGTAATGSGGAAAGGSSSGGGSNSGSGGASAGPSTGGAGGSSGTGGAGGGPSTGGAGGVTGSGGTSGEPAFKRVFVTSGRYSGDLHSEGDGTSGVSGADNLCNTLAEDAGLDGTWRAWLSVGVGAFDRIPTENAAWHLLDGESTLVFPSRESLQTAPIAAIDVDENGQRLTSATHVWTGTLLAGLPSGTNQLGRCASWNGGTATAGTYGDMKSTGTDWTDAGIENCDNNSNRLYCFEL